MHRTPPPGDVVKRLSKTSAAARTLILPGVSVRETSDNQAPESIDGPEVRIVGCISASVGGKQSFLAACDHPESDHRHTLCGLDLNEVRDFTLRIGQRLTKNICQACRVKASILRAVIVR